MRVYSYITLANTNDEARRLAERGVELPFVVQAMIQTQGRGQHGRTWSSPPGSLTATWAISGEYGTPDAKVDSPRNDTAAGRPGNVGSTASAIAPSTLAPVLALLAGLAVRDAVLPQAMGRKVQIKWPNDVWLDGKKLAGILCETSSTPHGRAFLIGIGVNVHCDPSLLPAEVAPRAAVLLNPGGSDDSTRPLRHPGMPFPPSPDSDIAQDEVALLRNAISDALLQRLDAWHAGQWPKLLQEIRTADVLGGKRIRVLHPTTGETVEGQALEIALDGSLLVRMTDGQTLSVHNGSVQMLPDEP